MFRQRLESNVHSLSRDNPQISTTMSAVNDNQTMLEMNAAIAAMK